MTIKRHSEKPASFLSFPALIELCMGTAVARLMAVEQRERNANRQ